MEAEYELRVLRILDASALGRGSPVMAFHFGRGKNSRFRRREKQLYGYSADCCPTAVHLLHVALCSLLEAEIVLD